MIIEFSVANFRSIYKKVTLDMLATKLTGKEATLSNIFHPPAYKSLPVLKSAVIYGANASGKSNLLKALYFFRKFIVKSTNLTFGQPMPYEPFRLFKHATKEPSSFEMDFIARDDVRYIYGFKITAEEVVEEYLSSFTSRKETKLFVRKKGEKIQFSSLFQGEKKVLENQLLNNNLLLSKAANSNYEQMQKVYTYFSQGFNVVLSSLINDSFSKKKSFEDTIFKKYITDFLKVADTGIEAFEVREQDVTDLKFPDEIPQASRESFADRFHYKSEVIHYTCDDSDPEQVRWGIEEESAGTVKLFSLAGPVIDNLNRGRILVFDEINNSLHPNIVKFIVDLFNNEKTNPKNAQLIFTTHDTTLLTKNVFRRDQVWFTEKNNCGMTDLYSLCNFDKKEVRWNIPFDKWYLTGRFGALPTVQDFKIKSE